MEHARAPLTRSASEGSAGVCVASKSDPRVNFRRCTADLPGGLPVKPDCLNRAFVKRSRTGGLLRRVARLLTYKTPPPRVVAGEIERRRLTAQVTVDARDIDKIPAGDILGHLVSVIGHGFERFSKSIWPAPNEERDRPAKPRGESLPRRRRRFGRRVMYVKLFNLTHTHPTYSPSGSTA